MKTRANHLFKSIFTMALVSTLFVSCGKDNSSGGSKKKNNYGTYNYGNITSYNGSQVPNNWLEVVSSQNPCISSGSYGYNGSNNNRSIGNRVRTVVPLQGINVNAGSVHVGVTPEGDIAIASNQNQGPVLEILLCPDATGQGSLASNPVLNISQVCPLSEITAADVSLYSNSGYGNYLLKFAPIHIPGTDRISQLCY